MEELADKFFSQIFYEKLRVKNLPNFVFLCGGDHRDSPVRAMRGLLYKYIFVKDQALYRRIKLAEDLQDWLESGEVDNLIDLEIALADMSAATVLILEGVGAYTELGSFSSFSSIYDKLILIVNERLIEPNTFINLGPIKYLESKEKLVFKYDWNVKYSIDPLHPHKVRLDFTDSNNPPDDISNLIYAKLVDTLPKIQTKTVKLDINKFGHLCFIIADLLYLFGALTFKEITKYVKSYFDFEGLSRAKVSTSLYLLEKLEFIEKRSVGDTFYLPTSNNEGFIKYSYDQPATGKRVTTVELKTELLASYSHADPARFAAITG